MTTSTLPIKIVTLTHGFVMVGRVERGDNALRLYGSSVIRRWGTNRGLGQLVAGPTPTTILDPNNGVVEVQLSAVIFTIDADGDAWKNACPEDTTA